MTLSLKTYQNQLIESQNEGLERFREVLREFERLSKSLKISQTQAKSSILGDSGWISVGDPFQNPKLALTGQDLAQTQLRPGRKSNSNHRDNAATTDPASITHPKGEEASVDGFS